MLFRSREQPDLATRVRLALWPRVSFSRSAQYQRKRVLRLTGSPHAIALGVAIGVFSSFTPLLGLHIVIALVIAVPLGANLIAAALGTAFANPLTIPFIWASTYKIGRILIGGPHFRGGADMPHNFAEKSLHAIWPVIKPMLVGAVPLGILAAVTFYVLVFFATRGFQVMRRERLAARRRQQKLEQAAERAAMESTP
jgi:uncharacterized protein (DUF2062 family)